MANEEGVVEFVLRIDGEDFVVGARRASKAIKKFEHDVDTTRHTLKGLERGVNGARSQLRDWFVTISTARSALVTIRQATYDWVMAIVDANARLEQLTALLSGLSKAQTRMARRKEGEKSMQWVIKMAQHVPFDLERIADAFVKFKTIDLKPMTGQLHGLMNAIAAFGGTGEELQRASVAIQQMGGKGVISMEELRQQLGESVPNAMMVMARSMNMTVGKLVKLVSKGSVKANHALRKMLVEMQLEYAGASQRLMNTWNGMVNKLSTRWLLFKKTLGSQGFFERMKSELENLVEAFGSNAVQNWAVRAGRALHDLVADARKLAEFLQAHWDTIVGTSKWIVAVMGARVFISALNSLRTTILGVSVVASAADFDRMFGHIATGVAKFSALSMEGKTLRGVLLALRSGALTLGKAIARVLGPIGLVVAAGLTLYGVFSKNSTAVERLNSALEKTRHTLEDVAKASEDISAAQIRLRVLSNTLKRLEQQRSQHTGEDLKRYDAMIARVRQEITDVRAAITKGMSKGSSIANEVGQRWMSNAMNAYMKFAREGVNRIKNALSKQMDAVVQMQKAGKFDEAAKARRNIIIKNGKLLRAAHEENIKKLQALLDKRKNKLKELNSAVAGASPETVAKLIQRRAEMRALIQKTTGMIRAARKEELEASDMVARQIKTMELDNGIGAGQNGHKTDAEKLMDRTIKKLAELKATNAVPPGQSYLGKLRADVELLKDSFKGTPEQFEQFKRKVLSMGQGIVKQQAIKKANKAMVKMNIETAKLKSKMNHLSDATGEWTAKLEAGKFGQVGTLIETGLYKPLLKAAKAADKLSAKIDQLKDKRRELMSDAHNLPKKIDTLNENLLGDTAKARLSYENDTRRVMRLVGQQARELLTPTQIAKNRKLVHQYMVARQKTFIEDLRQPVASLVDTWQDVNSQIQDVVANMSRKISDAFVNFARTGKFEVKDMVDYVLAQLLRIAIQKSVIGPIANAFSGVIAGAFAGGSTNFVADTNGPQNYGFANGGIMTPFGPAELRKYAMGGIASGPQVAVYGEGSTNEAYVPLPDGRTIPVTLKGGQDSHTDVTVKVINKTQKDVQGKQGRTTFDGRKYVTEVVLTEMNQPGSFRDGMRQAVR